MINETIINETGEKLSIHFNQENELVLTLEDAEDNGYNFRVIHLDKKDAEWIINRLKNLTDGMD